MSDLMKILPEELKEGLTPAEKKVLEVVPTGKEVNFQVGDEEIDNPANADKWDKSRTIRATLLQWLYLDTGAKEAMHPRGMQVIGAKVHGMVDLQAFALARPLGLIQSAIPNGITFIDATTRSISLLETHTTFISADRAEVNGALIWRGIVVTGEVRIMNARISGDIDCSSSTLKNPERIAFLADDLTVGGNVHFRDTHTEGAIRIPNAKISGDLNCDRAEFHNQNSQALMGDGLSATAVCLRDLKAKGQMRFPGAKVHRFECDGAGFENHHNTTFLGENITTIGPFFFREGKCMGEFSLIGADIGGMLDCSRTIFENPDGNALVADSLVTKGPFFLRQVKCKGAVLIPFASLGGGLLCSDSTFENPEGLAFVADGISSERAVFFDRVLAKGEVRFLSAAIRAQLSCAGAKFDNPEKTAFCADRLVTNGSLFLHKLVCLGEVRLVGASIGSNLECNSAHFENPKGIAFNAGRIIVKSDVFLKAISALGQVNLVGCTVYADLICSKARLLNSDNIVLCLERAKISGSLVLSDIQEIQGGIDLLGARVHQFVDDVSSQPCQDDLHLDGFEYNNFAGKETPKTVKDRLRWLALQPAKPFKPQPYEQLAKVFRSMGHRTAATKILIAKENARNKYGDVSLISKPMRWFSRALTGYGYQPWRIVYWIILSLMLGSVCFSVAYKWNIIHPSHLATRHGNEWRDHKKLPYGYTKFVPVLYALDLFFPVDLGIGQGDSWEPVAAEPVGKTFLGMNWGYWFKYFYWSYRILGGILSALIVFLPHFWMRRE